MTLKNSNHSERSLPAGRQAAFRMTQEDVFFLKNFKNF
jgi:hypothetical protein